MSTPAGWTEQWATQLLEWSLKTKEVTVRQLSKIFIWYWFIYKKLIWWPTFLALFHIGKNNMISALTLELHKQEQLENESDSI